MRLNVAHRLLVTLFSVKFSERFTNLMIVLGVVLLNWQIFLQEYTSGTYYY